MNLSGNTIVVTGGATGIGFELARQLLAHGNEVIVCGRREGKLNEARRLHPKLHTFVCDLSKEAERIGFASSVISDFPATNILINNAGIQQDIRFLNGLGEADIQLEVDINVVAPIHLTSLLLPHLLKKDSATIVNITSGLGIIPLAIVPVYSATKAAIHSYSDSLRHQLRETGVKVFELVPPTVDTELDRGAREKRGQKDRGISAEACAEQLLEALKNDKYFAPIGQVQNLVDALHSGKADAVFSRMNG